MSSTLTSRPRIALIGITGYAQIYVDLLLEQSNADRCELTSVAIIPPHQNHPNAELLRARGAKVYDSFDSLIAGEEGRMDLCIIPTGIHWHARMTIAALRAGANVLVEKPLAGSLSDAEAMIHTAESCRRWIAVGFQDIYAQDYLKLRERLAAGVIGTIESVKVLGLWPRSEEYYTRNQWAGRLFIDGTSALDSPLNNAFAHFVNLAFHLASSGLDPHSPITVEAAELFRARQIESFDTAVVKAHDERGVEFWFGVSHACDQYREPEVHVEGSNGSALWLHERHAEIRYANGEIERCPVPSYDQARQSMFDAVLRRCVDGHYPICGTDIALRHTRFIHELHRQCDIRSLTSKDVSMQRIPGHANEIPAIRNLNRLLDQAMEQRALLREVGFQPSLGSTP
jgi:predicted dehydrogenase